MFKLLPNSTLPIEKIKGILYELYPSNYLSIRPQTAVVIPFSIELQLSPEFISTIEILPQYTLKGLIAPNISFVNGDMLQLPVFYSYFPVNHSVLDDLFSRNILFIDQRNPVAKLWIKKVA